MNRAPPLVALAILAFNAVNSYPLFSTWIEAPLEIWTWIGFLIWILPIFLYWFSTQNHDAGLSAGNTFLLGLSLVAAFLSIMGSINALAYLGFALSLAALVPWSWMHFIWIAASASWMPALGWFYIRWLPGSSPLYLIGARLALAAAGMLAMAYFVMSAKEKSHG